MEEIQFGAYAVPVILTVILSIIYKLSGSGIPDRWKSLIAIFAGIGLGILSIPYNGLDWTVKIVVDRIIYGLMMGASATGLYEGLRTFTKPRE